MLFAQSLSLLFVFIIIILIIWTFFPRTYINNWIPAPIPSTLNAGIASMQGRRQYMEDTYCIKHISERKAMFAVYDGHGGGKASVYLADNMHKYLTFASNISVSDQLVNAFEQIDNDLLSLCHVNGWDDGSTACVVILDRDMIYCSNVGDSRCTIINDDGSIIPLSKDHRPGRQDERDRIEGLGGTIRRAGVLRVQGVLAVSRAFGNRRLRPFVNPIPELFKQRITSKNLFLVLSSDGLWEAGMPKDVMSQIVLSCNGNVMKASMRLVEQAISNGSADNITALVVNLQDPFIRTNSS